MTREEIIMSADRYVLLQERTDPAQIGLRSWAFDNLDNAKQDQRTMASGGIKTKLVAEFDVEVAEG
jgi:hypothetical protein